MSLHTLRIRQNIPASLEKVWEFISSPSNLKAITPPSMGFDIITPEPPPVMYEGMFITYRVKPLLGIPMRWVSEITHIVPMRYFIDEQRVGPYRIWHHEHHVEAKTGYVEMRDIIHYEVPFAIFGDVANAILVQGQLRKIFDYRRQSLETLFGKTG
jgi:ligand-binding SRPBCC domain-containing protein